MYNYFERNLRVLREAKGLSQSELFRMTFAICEEENKKIVDDDKKIKPITQASIARWEMGENSPSVDNVLLLARALDVNLPDLVGREINIDNGKLIELDVDTVQIPVLGTIKAGVPIEAQEEIIEYVEIPRKWTYGGKIFYGLKISGDSMFPKYTEGDTVIFEQNEDKEQFNNKDCAVMVNGDDATFKQVLLNDNGLVLRPYNNSYDIMVYSNEQIEKLPIRIIGIAGEKRTKL